MQTSVAGIGRGRKGFNPIVGNSGTVLLEEGQAGIAVRHRGSVNQHSGAATSIFGTQSRNPRLVGWGVTAKILAGSKSRSHNGDLTMSSSTTTVKLNGSRFAE